MSDVDEVWGVVDLDYGCRHQSNQDMAVLGAEACLQIGYHAVFPQPFHQSRSILRIGPDAEFRRRVSDNLVFGVPRHLGKTAIDRNIQPVLEPVDIDRIRVDVECFSEFVFARAQSPFGL